MRNAHGSSPHPSSGPSGHLLPQGEKEKGSAAEGPSAGAAPAALHPALPVSRETLDRLEAHRALLSQWASRINLIGPGELAHYWIRHALDSAQLILHAPEARAWVDLGSGAGFPGLVVACCLAERPGAEVVLIEPNQKRAAFLREAIRATAAPARVIAAKAEEAVGDLADCDAVTARALASLARITELAHPILSRGATGLFLKGADAEAELAAARLHWPLEASLAPSLSDPTGRIVRLKLQR